MAWLMFHIDLTHQYSFLLKLDPTGATGGKWQLEKKDNPAGDNTAEKEQILKTGTLPAGLSCKLGIANTWEMKLVGAIITVIVDGITIVTFDDSDPNTIGSWWDANGVKQPGNVQTPFMASTPKKLGFYSEDAKIRCGPKIYFSSAT